MAIYVHIYIRRLIHCRCIPSAGSILWDTARVQLMFVASIFTRYHQRLGGISVSNSCITDDGYSCSCACIVRDLNCYAFY